MPRNLTAAMQAQLASANVRPAYFVEIEFLNETIWVWSGIGNITPPGPASGITTFPYGQTFVGLGRLANISAIPQSKDVIAQNITLTLSGIPPDLVSDAINAVRLSGSATVWFAFFDGNFNIIGDPVQLFAGFTDVPTLTDGASDCTISITVENPLVALSLAPNKLFSDTDQQLIYPGDTGFAQVAALANIQLQWPNYYAPGQQSPAFTYLDVTPAGDSVAVSGTLQFKGTAYYTDGSSQDHTSQLTFATSNPKIATISLGGLARGVAPGICTIMAYSAQGSASSASLIVT